MASGIWTPLDCEKRQIRLAHLASSENHDDQPSCCLHIVSLDQSPQYEALSYAWGDLNLTTPIQLRSVHQSNTSDLQTIELSVSAENRIHSVQWPVTTNLAAALQYLRHRYTERILWIDTICIDQSNIEERSHQVPLMKIIYSSAVAVRVWLGSPTTGSDDAISILWELGRKKPLQEITVRGRLIDNNDLQSIINLMTRPWWNRTWVQQELILAERAVFHCGFSTFEWSEIPALIDFNSLTSSALKSLLFDEDILNDFIGSFDAPKRIQDMANIYGQGSEAIDEDFVLILALGRLCHSSDDRDSIYGFLGLMNENIASKIQPDYNMSIAEVFQDAAIQLTTSSQSLILFSLTQYTKIDDRWSPTWVPSWGALSGLKSAKEWSDRAQRLVQHEYFSACGEHVMNFEIVGRNILKLSGVRLDHVVDRSSVMMLDGLTQKELIHQGRQLRLLCDLNMHNRSRYITGGTTNEAYWRTLVNDLYTGLAELQRRCQPKDHEAYMEWLHELETSERAYWESNLANSFHIAFTGACNGRRLFVTKMGCFGTGPDELEEGDMIYILAGGKHPFALRPSPESPPDSFELVGDCYVHGIMDGEAVSENSPDRKFQGEVSYEELHGGQPPHSDLPLRDFHEVFIV